MNPAHTQPTHNSHTTCPCPPACLCRDTRSARWLSGVYKYGPFPSPSSWRPVALSTSKPSPRFSDLCQDAWLPASVSSRPGPSGPLPRSPRPLACLPRQLSPPRGLLVAAKTPRAGSSAWFSRCFPQRAYRCSIERLAKQAPLRL